MRSLASRTTIFGSLAVIAGVFACSSDPGGSSSSGVEAPAGEETANSTSQGFSWHHRHHDGGAADSGSNADSGIDSGSSDAGSPGKDGSAPPPSDGGSHDSGSHDSGSPDASPPPPPPPPADAGGATCTSGGGGPTGGPGELFPCDSVWRKDVSALPVASESSSVIAGIGSWGAGGRFLIDTSILFMHTDGSAPTHSFTIDYADESQSDPVPIPAGGAVEGESGYTCTGGGDCHLIVVDDGNHKLYELYSASISGSTYHAAQESVWDLTKHYTSAGRGLGCTSADAAGFSVMAGLIGVRETKAGQINHALRFILPNSKIRKGPSFVAPATHGTSATSSSTGPAYGTRLRLKSTFNEASITSPGGKAIVQALKQYGMMLADGGEYALTAEDDRFEKAVDPSLSWTNLLSASDLAAISPQDFEVVDYGTVTQSPSCTLLP